MLNDHRDDDDSAVGAGVRIALFGTSRLHRPFARQGVDGARLNYPPNSEPIFARMGYFHGAAEIAQKVEVLVRRRSIPTAILPFVFRVENRSTTPMNEFDSKLAAAIRSGSDFDIEEPDRILAADVVLVEISSLRANLHRDTGTMLHTNPNFLHNVSYPAIYPDGYYAKYAPWLGVDAIRESEDMLTVSLRHIQDALPDASVITMGHLASESAPQGGRLEQNSIVAGASKRAGVTYFDLAPFVDEYGFAETNGVVDYHHLSLAGEDALGQRLLSFAAELSSR